VYTDGAEGGQGWVNIRIWLGISIYMSIHIDIYTRMYIHIYIRIYMVLMIQLKAHKFGYIYTCMYRNICICICIYIY